MDTPRVLVIWLMLAVMAGPCFGTLVKLAFTTSHNKVTVPGTETLTLRCDWVVQASTGPDVVDVNKITSMNIKQDNKVVADMTDRGVRLFGKFVDGAKSGSLSRRFMQVIVNYPNASHTGGFECYSTYTENPSGSGDKTETLTITPAVAGADDLALYVYKLETALKSYNPKQDISLLHQDQKNTDQDQKNTNQDIAIKKLVSKSDIIVLYGSIYCGDYVGTHSFDKSYDKPPKVFVSQTGLFNSDTSVDPNDDWYSVDVVNVTKYGFQIRCRAIKYKSMEVWFIIFPQ